MWAVELKLTWAPLQMNPQALNTLKALHSSGDQWPAHGHLLHRP